MLSIRHSQYLLLLALAGLGLALVNLTTCGPVTCLDPDVAATPPIGQDEVEQAWELRFGALPRSCSNVVLGWQLLSDAEYQKLCPAGSSACINKNDCPVAYARARCNQIAQRAMYAHELSHWLLFCSRGDSDHQHTKAEIWGAEGFVKSFTPGVEPTCPAPEGVTSQPAAAMSDVLD
jgi:hypothetical protein